MPNTLYNDVSAPVNAATYEQQARPDKGDVDVWVAGFEGNAGILRDTLSGTLGGTVTPGSGMAVNVTALRGMSNRAQFSCNAVTNLTIATSDGTNDRIDLVIASPGGISVVTGSPASQRAWPSWTIAYPLLATVYVPAGSTSISSGQIVDKRIPLNGSSSLRQSVTYTTGSLAINGESQGTVTIAPSFRLLKITMNVAARVRLYDRTSKQTTDATRPIGNVPTGDHGVICDFVCTPTLLSVNTSPPILGSDMNATPTGVFPITVDNLTGTTQSSISVTLVYFAEE